MPKVFLVHLRPPRGENDKRFDPYWEGGSFGKSGCHRRNLMHPRHCRVERGDRLAFIQAFRGVFRVVGLTPPITQIASLCSGQRLEALWDSTYRPWRFEDAPRLIDNAGGSDFPMFASQLKIGGRTSLVSAVSSQFRARADAVASHLGSEIARICDAWPGLRAANYIEAIRPAGDRWYERAKRAGWSDAGIRRADYDQLTAR